MILIHSATGQPVKLGDAVRDFRGDPAKVTSWELPRHSGSTGRVYVVTPEGWIQGYYPAVFDLEWRKQ